MGKTGVSRETLERLKIYADLLVEWQGYFNLVSKNSIPMMWHRHFYDSAQLLALAPEGSGPWLDLGSGAGFPGMVLAIMGRENISLVESNGKKVKFLIEVAKATGTKVRVVHDRIEKIKPFKAAVLSARAVASLPDLLDSLAPFIDDHSICLFPKGQDVEFELTAAAKCWNMNVERCPSHTSSDSQVLRLRHVQRIVAR